MFSFQLLQRSISSLLMSAANEDGVGTINVDERKLNYIIYCRGRVQEMGIRWEDTQIIEMKGIPGGQRPTCHSHQAIANA